MKTRQIPFFFHLLFPLELFVTFIFVFGNSQNSFSCGPPFGPFWSVKYLNFGRKLRIRTTHDTSLESRNPDVTKNPYYVFPPKGAKKGISSWTNTVTLHFYPSFFANHAFDLVMEKDKSHQLFRN